MKKIMIYSKRRKYNMKELTGSLKQESTSLLQYTAFICGILTVCSFLLGLTPDSILFTNAFSHSIANTQCYIINNFITIFFLLLLSAFGGMSCFGTIVHILTMFLLGGYSGYTAYNCMMLSQDNSIKTFCFSFLPMLIICAVSMILFGNDGNILSAQITYNVMTGTNEKIDIRTYLIKALLCFLICLGAIMINALIIRLIR